MTPQGHLVHLALVYGQSSHICGKIIKIFNLFTILLPYILDLVDTTSQRKLAHIQRVILLNYHFNSITDTPVLWQYATSQYYGPKVILFYFYIFPDHSC